MESITIFAEPVTSSAAAQVAIIAVLLLIALDVIFGCGNAIAHHAFSSEKMREGMAHKAAEIGFVLVGIIADACILGGFDLGYSAPILTSVCLYLALMEIASLLETFAQMNPQLANSPVFRLLKSVEGIATHDESGRV